MARPPRIQFENAFYHVYSRGNRRQRIFWDAEDYHEFEQFLLAGAFRSDIHLYQWRLMPNHFHFLPETPKANLALFMQRLLTGYAGYFNRKYKQVGHVFQGRYGARLCDKETYFLELIRYIALNAHRAKNWAKMVERGEDKWSSHRFFISGDEPEIIRPYIHAVLRRFSDDLPQARTLYAAFIAEGLTDPKAIRSLPRSLRYLGNEEFIKECKEKAGIMEIAQPCTLNLDQLIERVKNQFGVTEAELRSTQRNQRVVRARRMLVYAAKLFCGISGNVLAQKLQKDSSAISHMFRLQQQYSDDPALTALVADGLSLP